MRHHGAGLRKLKKSQNFLDALTQDYRTAPIPDADRLMLDYAIKLTDSPAGMAQRDVEKLRVAGFSHPAILDICQITAYFNFVNRIAAGLGVELEPYWENEEKR